MARRALGWFLGACVILEPSGCRYPKEARVLYGPLSSAVDSLHRTTGEFTCLRRPNMMHREWPSIRIGRGCLSKEPAEGPIVYYYTNDADSVLAFGRVWDRPDTLWRAQFDSLSAFWSRRLGSARECGANEEGAGIRVFRQWSTPTISVSLRAVSPFYADPYRSGVLETRRLGEIDCSERWLFPPIWTD
jgi:hypothetical protein